MIICCKIGGKMIVYVEFDSNVEPAAHLHAWIEEEAVFYC